MDLFLKRMGKIYLNNPDLPVKSDTIYSELSSFSILDGDIISIAKTDLSNVQEKIYHEFIFSGAPFMQNNNYFYWLDSKQNNDENAFFKQIYNSIKMYVAVDDDSAEYVWEQIITFIRENHIISQSKISKKMRNDAIVLRIANMDDAKAIANFINNNLNYHPKYHPNPFLYSEGKVACTMDGKISYNANLASNIAEYLTMKRENHDLERVSLADFNEYLSKYSHIDDRDIDVYNKTGSANLCNHLLYANLNGQITSLDYFNHLQKINQSLLDAEENEFLPFLKDLAANHQNGEAYDIIETYLKSKDISGEKKEEIKSNVAWKCFINACKATAKKYDFEQVVYATKELLLKRSYTGFTNDENSRNILQMAASYDALIFYLYNQGISREDLFTLKSQLSNLAQNNGFAPYQL